MGDKGVDALNKIDEFTFYLFISGLFKDNRTVE